MAFAESAGPGFWWGHRAPGAFCAHAVQKVKQWAGSRGMSETRASYCAVGRQLAHQDMSREAAALPVAAALSSSMINQQRATAQAGRLADSSWLPCRVSHFVAALLEKPI